jgi:hypothetical protein
MNTHIKEAESQKAALEGKIKGFLFWMETTFKEKSEAASDSYSLLDKIGQKDPLAQYVESIINNPVGTLFEVKSSIDDIMRTMAITALNRKFLSHHELAHQIGLKSTAKTHISYVISLKQDSTENRRVFFSILSELEFSQFGESLTFDLKFVRPETIMKIEFVSKLL